MSIVGYWKFNGNANDYSGNAFNGTAANISYSQTYGKLSQGASLNGSSSKIDTSSSLSLTGFSQLTVSCWMYPTSLAGSADKLYISCGDLVNNPAYYCRLNRTGSLSLFVDKDASNYSYYTTSTTPIVINKWYHVVMTWTGATACKIYVNGSEIAGSYANGGTGATSMEALSMFLRIGNNNIGSFWYTGYIDEVIIDKTAWTIAKIKNEYSKVKGFF